MMLAQSACDCEPTTMRLGTAAFANCGLNTAGSGPTIGALVPLHLKGEGVAVS
jgi:hypothetical protein